MVANLQLICVNLHIVYWSLFHRWQPQAYSLEISGAWWHRWLQPDGGVFENNRVSTVSNLFLDAINMYGLLSRVHSDQGRENILVARHMVKHRGADRRSMITGSFVHNQRMWRDLFRCAIKLY